MDILYILIFKYKHSYIPFSHEQALSKEGAVQACVTGWLKQHDEVKYIVQMQVRYTLISHCRYINEMHTTLPSRLS